MTDAETVKSKIDIVDFISEYVSLKKAGRNFKACCPFHNEKTPSFVVSPERQTWHCFGACGEGGDAIKFLQKWENLEFREALEILAKKNGVTLSSYNLPGESKFKETLYEINHLASEFFHYLLISHKMGEKGRIYLKDRKIKDETIKTFMLGYAPVSWDSLSKFLQKKGYNSEDIYKAGLSVRSDRGRYYDRFRGRLIFTLFDHRGNVVGFSGRVLPPAGEKEAKYINTSDTPVYTKGDVLYGLNITRDSIKKENEAIAVEGEFDLLSSFQNGVTNVVAIKGSALTKGQVSLLKRYTQNLKLALDSDFAGNEAARRGIDIAEEASLNVKVIKVPLGKDPAECILENPHLWKKAVKEAVPIYDFIIDNAFSKYEKEGVIGKKKIGDEIVPYLNKINNPIIISHYIKNLANRLGVTEESIELVMNKSKKEESRAGVMEVIREKVSRELILEEYLLSLVIQSEDIKRAFKLVEKEVNFTDFSIPPIAQIFEKLSLYSTQNDVIDMKAFVKILSPEVIPEFDKAYLLDIENILKDSLKHEKEIIATGKKIKLLSSRRKINFLTTKIRQLEDKGENEKINSAREELKNLITSLNLIDKSGQKN